MANFFASYPPINGNTAGNNSVSQNGQPIPTYSTQVAGENPSGNLEPLQTDSSGNLKVALSAEPLTPFNTKDAADGTPGSAIPTTAIQVAGSDGTNLRTLATDTTGKLNINNISGTVSLPTGAATASNQTTANTSLSSIVTNTANIPAKGQALMAASTPVAIASDQSTIPVSATSLPLPTGAATSANQTNGSQKTQIVDGSNNVIGSTSNALDVAVTQPLPAGTNNIGSITNITGTVSLPTGAATAANQTTGNTSLSTIATNTGNIPAKGQATMANSTPVAIASDQSNVPVAIAAGTNTIGNVNTLGGSAVNHATNNYSSSPVTTSAYTQLIASTSATCQSIEIFDSSGQALVLATGASGLEADQIYITPGGNGRVPLSIASGTRISIKAVTATANSGAIYVNLYGAN